VKPGTNNAAEKRRREVNRQKWQQEKASRKQQRQAEREARGALGPDEDPDLIGIVPGPQPGSESDLEQAPQNALEPSKAALSIDSGSGKP
jgi:hypothetical protein